MSKKPLLKTAEERRQITRDWLTHCALEGIYPDAATLVEFEQVDASHMTAEDYLTYLNAKYPAKAQIK